MLSRITDDDEDIAFFFVQRPLLEAVPAKIIPPVEDKLTEERKSGELVAVTTAGESIFKTL